jgi:predicted small secreted protein
LTLENANYRLKPYVERNRKMPRNTKAIAVLVVLAVAGAGLQGCNTFRGAGKDIQRGGKAIENAATDVQFRDARKHTILASAQPGGSISPSGLTNTSAGSDRTYRIKADRGFQVADVQVDGRSMGPISRHTFDNLDSNHTIVALFARNPGR